MSRLVLGTSDLASAKSPTTILDAAWALGITTFDVAPVYGKNGAAETALGSWLALRRIPREDVVLVGKAGAEFHSSPVQATRSI
jgi:aryl-alcohol dehydrogenase-like predicted oxidoreductase